jgi:hypothetical protein
MANTDNKCSELEVNDFHTGTEDTLGLIYNKQKELQERYGFNFENWSIKQIVDFWMVNKHALGDELNEMFDAIGGINDGIGSAGWKYWKGKNKETEKMKISDLSESDKLELYYEWIDGLHFYMNFAISIGMTSKDIVNLYMAKQQENHRRQDSGY